jgi:hypothetical protein
VPFTPYNYQDSPTPLTAALLKSREQAIYDAAVASAASPTPVVDINTFAQPTAQTNWATLATSSTQWFNASVQSSGAQNDEITFAFYGQAGTYSLEAFFRGGPNFGAATFSIDGTDVGTIDMYVGAATTKKAAIPVTITSGVHALRVRMADKNPSSTGYYGALSRVTLTKTG